MMRLKQYTGLVLFSIGLVACEPESIPIDIPQAESKLVVHSQALPDQALLITLSKSFSALSFPGNDEDIDSTVVDSLNQAFLSQFLVNDAVISLEGADYNDTLVRVTNGVFLAPFFPFTPGNSYQLSAYDPVTGLRASSNATTLPIVEFDSLSAQREPGIDSAVITLDFQIDDIAGDNYYLMNLYTDSVPESNFFSYNSFSEDRSFSFSDREYPTGKVKDQVKFYIPDSDTLVISLTNISKDYFEFLEARKRSGSSFLSEPVEYPSNVINGYGYFTLHAPSFRAIEIQ